MEDQMAKILAGKRRKKKQKRKGPQRKVGKAKAGVIVIKKKWVARKKAKLDKLDGEGGVVAGPPIVPAAIVQVGGSSGSGEAPAPALAVVAPGPGLAAVAPGRDGDAEAREGGPVARGERDDNEIQWGEFSISAIKRNTPEGKIHIGWGGVCRKHWNAADVEKKLTCKKQVTFPPGSPPEVCDDARRLIKCWLLMGRRVPAADIAGQHVHVHGMGGRGFRANAPAWTEAHCDEMVLEAGRYE